MYRFYPTIFFKFLALLLLVFCVGCVRLSDKVTTHSYILPPNATNVVYLNDNWGKFELEGQIFYFTAHRGDEGIYFPIGKEGVRKDPIKFKCPNCGATVVVTDLGAVHERN